MSVVKVTDLTATTSLTDDDLFMVVDSPGSSPASKKITASNVKAFTSVGVDNYHGVESIGTISFDNSTHVLTLSAVTYWYKGTQYTTSSAVTCDLDLTADRDHASATLTANTLYYFRFIDATGKLYWSPSFWNLHETVPVATVFWNGSAGAVSKESHGYSRNIDWHIWAHLTVGCRFGTGLEKTYPTASVDGSLQIEIGTIYDEDLAISTGQQTVMRGWYKVDAATFTFADYSLPYLGTTGAPVYLDTDTYALTTFAANKYICYWVFATADQGRPIAIIPSHVSTPYSQAADARAELQPSISGVNPEWKLIYRWIYSGDGQFVESADYRLQTSIAGGVSASTNAGAVAFTPSGNIAATNVQTAIEELDTEKSATSHTHSDATTGTAGFMSATDKTKLDGVATGATAYTDALARSAVIASSISDGDTTHAPDGNSVYDALALKAPLASPTFGGTVDVSGATLTLADDQISGSKINSYMGKNAIINGNFDIWQRGTSFAAIANGFYSSDRFGYYNTTTSVHTISQSTDVPTQEQSGLKSNYSLKVECTTADTVLDSGVVHHIGQRIEGYNFIRFVGKQAILSFWIKSSKTGTYCVSFRSSSSDRSYVAEYIISQANTWEKKTIVITFNYSGGTWDYTNGLGININFSLGSGSASNTTKDTWQSGNYTTTSNQVNFSDTIGNTLYLSQVQLELGPVATDFEYRPYGIEMSLCQRYYEAKTVRSENGSRHISLVTKRASPTVAVGVGSAANATVDGFELTHSAAADCTVTATIEL